jgi:peroxin-19
MLDEFVPPKAEPKAATTSSKPTTTTQPSIQEDGLSDEDFAKQLQQGMAELLGGLENDPEMASQFEAMMKELTSEPASQPPVPPTTSTKPTAAPSSSSKQTPSTSSTKKKAKKEDPEDFQETIRKTMERLNASGTSASAAAASSANSEEDLMAEMLKAMQASGFGGENGEGNEEDFSKMLLGMMEQLTNKEILYEPMKELHDKFPEWMVKNEGTVKEDDMKRYKEQQIYVREIVERFEKNGYSDENAGDREYIVERMQKVCFFDMSVE